MKPSGQGAGDYCNARPDRHPVTGSATTWPSGLTGFAAGTGSSGPSEGGSGPRPGGRRDPGAGGSRMDISKRQLIYKGRWRHTEVDPGTHVVPQQDLQRLRDCERQPEAGTDVDRPQLRTRHDRNLNAANQPEEPDHARAVAKNQAGSGGSCSTGTRASLPRQTRHRERRAAPPGM